jgi:uncharacterized protein YceH (UPF0502 family)
MDQNQEGQAASNAGTTPTPFNEPVSIAPTVAADAPAAQPGLSARVEALEKKLAKIEAKLEHHGICSTGV